MRCKREREGGSVGPRSRSQAGEGSVIEAAVGVLSRRPLPASEKKSRLKVKGKRRGREDFGKW
jgi:hypothetical protein